MIRLVLDTNVLVSGFLKPRGSEGRIIDVIVAGVAQLCLSDPILEEYRELLMRPKFGFDSHRVASLLRKLKLVSVHTDPPVRLSV